MAVSIFQTAISYDFFDKKKSFSSMVSYRWVKDGNSKKMGVEDKEAYVITPEALKFFL